MNLIIEAGGTKSNLAFVKNGVLVSSFTDLGLNLSRETNIDLLKKAERWNDLSPHKLDAVFLFAAGVDDGKINPHVKVLLAKVFDTNNIQIHSDMLAACYATAGENAGIVGILGTGANSCYFNGQAIVKNVSPGGFILGDEGSAAFIGKKFLIDYLRAEVPNEIEKQLIEELNISAAVIIQNIYGGSIKDSVGFCSSIAQFIITRVDNNYCFEICKNAIVHYLDFVKKHYLSFSSQLYLVGSVAFHLQEIIKEEAHKKNIEIVKIIQHPIKNLSIFLTNKYLL